MGKIKGEIDALRKESRTQAERQARQNILNAIGAITERFGASSCYLFVGDWKKEGGGLWIDEKSKLEPYLDHNTSVRVKP